MYSNFYNYNNTNVKHNDKNIQLNIFWLVHVINEQTALNVGLKGPYFTTRWCECY